MDFQAFFPDLQLSENQQAALAKLTAFLSGSADVFILAGSAGTGKTTLLKGFLKSLQATERPFKVMAPTGRAAKILTDKTGFRASTIHKTIYNFKDIQVEETSSETCYFFGLSEEDQKTESVYIVDEASMVSAQKSHSELFRFGSGFLLSDLIRYTHVLNANAKAKIIFIGDPCQLSPVTDNDSVALNAEKLTTDYGLQCESYELTKVHRQAGTSPILQKADELRQAIKCQQFTSFNLTSADASSGVQVLSDEDFLKTWQQTGNTKIVIAYKNETCTRYNKDIREALWGNRDCPPQPRDIFIISSNNYTLNVFNGEFALVNSAEDLVVSREVRFRTAGKKDEKQEIKTITLQWRRVELILRETDGAVRAINTYIFENFLLGAGKLTPDLVQALMVDFRNRNPDLKPKTKTFIDALKSDPYFNALLVRYGYVVTCHKAQGGEWKNTFVVWDYSEVGKSPTDKHLKNEGFFRWAYTAITRASKHLYPIAPPQFNPFGTMFLEEFPLAEAFSTIAASDVESFLVDEEAVAFLSRLGVHHSETSLQEHLLTAKQALSAVGVAITGWSKLAYEVRYQVSKDGTAHTFRTYINGAAAFKKPFTLMSGKGIEWVEATEKLLNNLPTIKWEWSKNGDKEVPVSQEPESIWEDIDNPSLKALYDVATDFFRMEEIAIEKVEHLSYRERYYLMHGNSKSKVDFTYDGKNVFGFVQCTCISGNDTAIKMALKAFIASLKN